MIYFQVIEERNRWSADLATQEETLKSVRGELDGQISRLRAEHEEKVQDLENRLQTALGNKQHSTKAPRSIVQIWNCSHQAR